MVSWCDVICGLIYYVILCLLIISHIAQLTQEIDDGMLIILCLVHLLVIITCSLFNASKPVC